MPRRDGSGKKRPIKRLKLHAGESSKRACPLCGRNLSWMNFPPPKHPRDKPPCYGCRRDKSKGAHVVVEPNPVQKSVAVVANQPRLPHRPVVSWVTWSYSRDD